MFWDLWITQRIRDQQLLFVDIQNSQVRTGAGYQNRLLVELMKAVGNCRLMVQRANTI